MDPSPRSLILDLLSTVGRASAPVRALVSGGAIFGIGGNRLRVALARLLAEGLVERDVRGSYRLGPAADAVSEQIRGWRDIEARRGRWDGGWIGVHTSSLAPASARERRGTARALRLLGFRTFAAGLALRPDNLAGGIADVRRRLAALGSDAQGLVFGLRDLDDRADAHARGLWGEAELVAAYRTTRAALETSAARLPQLPREAAMAESFRLGGSAIRQIVLDPLLPEPIVPSRERSALLAAMRRYDRLGRDIWKGWLGDDRPAPDQLPAGVRDAGPAHDRGAA